jgi:hypothetical protein
VRHPVRHGAPWAQAPRVHEPARAASLASAQAVAGGM